MDFEKECAMTELEIWAASFMRALKRLQAEKGGGQSDEEKYETALGEVEEERKLHQALHAALPLEAQKHDAEQQRKKELFFSDITRLLKEFQEARKPYDECMIQISP